MGIFGEFIYGDGVDGDVYGSSEAASISVLSVNSLLVRFESTVVVNDAVTDIANYSVTSTDGVQVAVRSVVTPAVLTVTQVIVEIDRPTIGATYTLTVAGLLGVARNTVSAVGEFVPRRTKLDYILKGLPTHFDRRVSSNPVLVGFLAAISISDDLIGGSQSE